jgi:RNA polymerase sigma-70 factor (ECF subfamily)
MKLATLRLRHRPFRRRLPQITAESDEAILSRYCQTRQREDFAQLVYRYERELFSYLRRYLGDAEMADDVFQATFLQIHLKCEQFEPDRRFRPWMYTIATHQAIDAQRRKRRTAMVSLDRHGSGSDDDAPPLIDLVAQDGATPEQPFTDAERQQWLKGALAQLNDGLRQVLSLVYFQGLKYREAADVLGVPVGTVKSRINSAVAKLNQIWHSEKREL